MRMTESEALSFNGSLLMRMMGVLLVIADCVVANDKQRDYFIAQEDEPWNCAAPYYVESDGFCAWAIRRDA